MKRRKSALFMALPALLVLLGPAAEAMADEASPAGRAGSGECAEGVDALFEADYLAAGSAFALAIMADTEIARSMRQQMTETQRKMYEEQHRNNQYAP